MKQCPECRRIYTDETLNYCLDDGTTLIYGPGTAEPDTAILSGDRPSEAPTKHISSPIRPGTIPLQPATSSKRIRFAWLVAGLAAVILVFGIGYAYYRSAKARQVESIAVMPFANESNNPDLEYLSDGITESLINALSQLPKLAVKGRSSVFRYKGKEVEPQQVGTDLSVQAVLNGRVLQRGDNLTISLDMTDTSTGNQIWGDQYTRKVGDLAALQTEISHDVAEKLRTKLSVTDEARVVNSQTQNSEAYQLYLQGRYYWNKRTGPSVKKAIEFFQQAIDKDPNYAMAYVGLAESYVVSDNPMTDELPRSLAAANKALELDPGLGEPHASIANFKDVYENDYSGAEAEFKRAIELNPNYPTAYHWYGESLVFQGRFDEGFAQYRKALELDPYSLAIGTDYGLALAFARRFDEALDYLNKLADTDPSYVRAHEYLARTYLMAERYEDAIGQWEKQMTLSGVDPATIARGKEELLTSLRTSGPKGYWSKRLEIAQRENETGRVPNFIVARIYSHLGDRDKAFEYLNKSVDQKEGVMELKISPEWDDLRSDPRWPAVLRRMNYTP